MGVLKAVSPTVSGTDKSGEPYRTSGKKGCGIVLRSFLFSESIAALYFPLCFALKVSDCDTFSLFPNGERKGGAGGTPCRKFPFANRVRSCPNLRKGVFALSIAEGLTALLRSAIMEMSGSA